MNMRLTGTKRFHDRGIRMENKNFYREFNKPVHQNNPDDKFLNIFIGVVILTLSLLSYGFWDAVFNWLS